MVQVGGPIPPTGSTTGRKINMEKETIIKIVHGSQGSSLEWEVCQWEEQGKLREPEIRFWEPGEGASGAMSLDEAEFLIAVLRREVEKFRSISER